MIGVGIDHRRGIAIATFVLRRTTAAALILRLVVLLLIVGEVLGQLSHVAGLGQYALDGTLRVGSVVLRHVPGQFIYVDGLADGHGTSKPLAVGYAPVSCGCGCRLV